MSFKPFSRRTVLRGVGTGLSLPLLEVMQSGRAIGASGAAAPTVRMACLFFANGVNVDQWRPTGEGADYQLSSTLEPLAELKGDMIVMEGLTQNHARANGDGAGDHARNARGANGTT